MGRCRDDELPRLCRGSRRRARFAACQVARRRWLRDALEVCDFARTGIRRGEFGDRREQQLRSRVSR